MLELLHLVLMLCLICVNSCWSYRVAVRRTYVFTLQEVKKICRTLQSHVMLVWEGSRTASFFKPQVAIFQLRSSHKLQIYEQSVTGWINFNPSAGGHCQRDIKEAPLYESQRISA